MFSSAYIATDSTERRALRHKDTRRVICAPVPLAGVSLIDADEGGSRGKVRPDIPNHVAMTQRTLPKIWRSPLSIFTACYLRVTTEARVRRRVLIVITFS